jgi:hypothetical protein
MSIGMRFGLEQDATGNQVAIMRLDNALGEVNKYNIFIGDVTTMNMVVDKTTFYQSVDIDGQFTKCNSFKATQIDVTGNIVSSKFKVTQAVTNLNDIFGGTGSNEVIIKNNIGCGGGTIIFHISCGGYATSGGLKTYTFRYKDAVGNIMATISAPFYFNQTGVHHSWSRSQSFTGIPSNNMYIAVQRNDNTLRHDANDFFTIVMEEFPF